MHSTIHGAARIFVHSLIVLGAGRGHPQLKMRLMRKNTIVLSDLNYNDLIVYSIILEITSWIWVRVSNFCWISSKWLCIIHLGSNVNSAYIFWILAKLWFHRSIACLCGIYTSLNNKYNWSVQKFAPHRVLFQIFNTGI